VLTLGVLPSLPNSLIVIKAARNKLRLLQAHKVGKAV